MNKHIVKWLDKKGKKEARWLLNLEDSSIAWDFEFEMDIYPPDIDLNQKKIAAQVKQYLRTK